MRVEREKIYIYGKHALTEALSNAPHVVKKIFLSSDINDQELKNLIRKNGIPIAELKNKEASRMVGQEAAHQGVIAIADPGRLMVNFSDFIKDLKISENTMLVLLDELTDPHNVGAIVRSAAAFGAAGVLMPEHRQAPVTGVVAKSSAGMVFRVPMVSIGNVNYTISALKDAGFKAYALTMDGKVSTNAEKFDSPSLFVIGNEGKGIREKTLELCDNTLRIPMSARAESLNASVSAGLVLYEWGMQHKDALL